MTCAPISITTLCRYEHFRRCVESLSRCTHADTSHLYIGLDFPLHKSHETGYRLICDYLPQISGFGEVTVLRRETNYGASKNARDLTELIYSTNDCLIRTEDDNEFSVNFLDYMNKCLEKFKNEHRVLAICGHARMVTIPSSYQANYYYGRGFSAWGYGTWKDRRGKGVYSPEDLKAYIGQPELLRKLKYHHPEFFRVVIRSIESKRIIYGDGARVLNMIRNEQFCVFPTISKVRNHGHDGTGIHGGKIKNSPFKRVKLDTDPSFEFLGTAIINDPMIEEILRKYRIPGNRLARSAKEFLRRNHFTRSIGIRLKKAIR